MFVYTDINECEEGACADLPGTDCLNTEGSFECAEILPTSTYYDSVVDLPLEVDECATNNGGCSHTCADTEESYYCECPTGYTLAGDNHSCVGKSLCMHYNDFDKLST